MTVLQLQELMRKFPNTLSTLIIVDKYGNENKDFRVIYKNDKTYIEITK